MKKQISTLVGTVIILVSTIVLFGGAFGYQYFAMQNYLKVNSIQAAGWNTYTNNEYGFQINFPNSWRGYTIVESSWSGQKVDGSGTVGDYKGPEIIFKNPQTTSQQAWQDIPIMVFTHNVWNFVSREEVAVSAAPIGPGKIGENAKYVFATPPRWYGFTDAIGFQEAVEIVKTFKTL